MTATLSAKAGSLDLVIEQGATFTLPITWTDENDTAINLTGYSARLKVRINRHDLTPVLELTDGSGITLGGAAGTIDVVISATDTAAIKWTNAVYDLELVNGSNVRRLLTGNITVLQEVTR